MKNNEYRPMKKSLEKWVKEIEYAKVCYAEQGLKISQQILDNLDQYNAWLEEIHFEENEKDIQNFVEWY